jgi:hypothetical protein
MLPAASRTVERQAVRSGCSGRKKEAVGLLRRLLLEQDQVERPVSWESICEQS